LLDLLTSEDQCVKFLHALQLTGQQHVVNFIKQNGGQIHRTRSRHNLPLKVEHAHGEKQSNRISSHFIYYVIKQSSRLCVWQFNVSIDY